MAVVPFPRVRDRNFVVRHAARMAELSHKMAETYLALQLQVQVDTMARRGIAPDLIEQQRHALERAVRAERWRMLLVPGDTA